MPSWLENIAGPNFAPAVLWTLLALVVLVIVLVIVRIVRSMTFGTFVVGGRNRKTRLAVMDAAAVDSQRRLVLVRRDDIEHLILIGGPTDVVVERDIRLHAPTRRPAPPHAEAAAEQQAVRPRPAEPAAQPRPQQQRQAAPPPPVARPEQRQPAAPPPPARAPVATVNAPPARMPPTTLALQPNFSTPRPAPPAPPPAASAPKPRPQDFDKPAGSVDFNVEPTRKKPEMSLEDEMNRLLGELSNKR